MEGTQKTKRNKLIAAGVCIAVAVCAVVVLALSGNGSAKGTTYSSYTVVTGNVEVAVQGSGTLEAGDQQAYTLPNSGSIAIVSASNGDTLQKGDLIAVMIPESGGRSGVSTDDSNAVTNIRTSSAGVSSVLAPVSGRIKGVNASINATAAALQNNKAPLCWINQDGQMTVAFAMDDVSGIERGQSVQVTVDGQTLEGSITSVKNSNDQTVVTIEDDTFAIGSNASVTDESGTKLGEGTLQLSDPIPVVAPAGYVLGVNVEENQKVSSGATLFTLADTGLDSGTQKVVAVFADRNGVLADASLTASGEESSSSAQSSATTSSGYTIQGEGSYTLTIAVDELDIAAIQPGQQAQITIEALSGQTVTGTVQRVSRLGTTTGNVTTYDVTLQLDTAEGLYAGMNAQARIVTQSSENVVTVPVEALLSENGKYYVLSGDAVGKTGDQADTEANRIEVTIGLANGSVAEIQSGLSVGDTVAIPNTSASTNSNSMQQMMNGMNGGQPQDGERPQFDGKNGPPEGDGAPGGGSR